MSAPTPADPDRDPGRAGPPGRIALVVMATVLTFALIVFVYGVLSLILDRDVIREPDAGPIVGPAMVVTVLAVVARTVIRERPVPLVGRGLTAALAVVVGSPLVGAVVYSIARGELGVIPFFFGEYVLSPFVLASGVVSAVIVLVHALLRQGPSAPDQPGPGHPG